MWSRRKFLRFLMGGLASLFLEACHLRPRPTPQVTSPPPWLPTATPTPRPTPSPIPSTVKKAYLPHLETHEKQPTPAARPPHPTSTPTPTPTPTATVKARPTPFPPGPASKLGVFVAYNHPQLFDLLHTGNLALVKTLELDPTFLQTIKHISPSTLVVARLTPLEDIDWMKVDPRALARNFVNRLLPIAADPRRHPFIDAWEAYNEPVVEQREAMQRLADFEAERTRLLAREGITSCVGNFPTGHPKLDLWPHFFPALHAIKEHGGYLGLHEYDAPYMWSHVEGPPTAREGWLTLRYRKAYRLYLQPAGLQVPLLITETGIDGPGGGWKKFVDLWRREGRVTTTPAGFYVEQLAWYDNELVRDTYVKAAAIYALVVFGQPSYEIVGPCAEILRQYLSVHPQH